MWFLSWPTFALVHGLNPLFTNYQYYPDGVNLMWNTSVLLAGLVLSPITWLGGPVLSYNVLATASLALSAWSAFMLLRRFVSSQLAAGAGALLYGFSPYMTAHSLAHPNLTAAFIPPLVLLLLDDIVRVQGRVLAVALFSDTWIRPTTSSIGVNSGDPQQFMWFLSWPTFALVHGLNPLFTNYQYYPDGVNLMWNTSVLLAGLVLSPITWLGGPVLSYNVLATASLALSAWSAFMLLRRFVSSQLAAGAGALLYGFSPYMTAHSLAHPNLTAAFIPPLVLLLLDDIVRVQGRRPAVAGVLLGLAGAAQLLIGEELLVTTAIVVVLLVCLAIALRPDQVRPRIKRTLVGLGCAAVVFVVLAAGPILFQLFGPRRVQGVVHPLNVYVSDALSFVVPTRLILLAPDSVVAVSDKFAGGVVLVEVNSYVGVPLILLLVFIAVRYWRRLV
ncbi:MAG: hypothetical protein E6H82_15775, partial [Chloroflexi bacterium]